MKKTMFALFIILVSLFAACQTNSAALYGELGRATDPIPFMEDARTGYLASGLRYYIFENSRPQGRAFLTLAVNAGSVLETEDERGLAHFVEHMAFNGTENFPGTELVNYLRSLGMRFGPEVNAYTSFDQTVYGIEVPVETVNGQRLIPDTALSVIDDWSRAITFLPEDVDNERRVIIEEYRTRLGAAERIRREMLPVIFRGSPYADRLPIGRLEVLETATPELLEGFYRKWYRPDNMALIFVGDFDAELLEASLEQHFRIRPASTPLERPRYTLPEPEKGSFHGLVITDPEHTQTRVDLYFKLNADFSPSDLESYRIDVMDYLVNTILGFRFNEAASRPETPYTGAASGKVPYGFGSRYYILTASAKSGRTSDVLWELLTVKESISRHGFLEDELDMAKRSLLSLMEQAVAEKDNQNSNYFIRTFTRHFLEGGSVPDIEWELQAIRNMLPGITLNELSEHAGNYFADDDLTVFIAAPDLEGPTLPTVEEIRLKAVNIRHETIAPPVSFVVQSELLEQTPSPGRIINEAHYSDTDSTLWTLSNRMEVVLKETQNRNNEITFYALARGGTASFPETRVSVSLAAEMLNASGLGPYTRPELARILADKQVSYSFWASAFLRGFQGSAAGNDIKVLMEMIHLGFTQPRLDPDAVSILLERRRTAIIQEAENPDRFFSREISKTISGNPLFHPLEAQDLDMADMNEAMEFILRSFNPADFTFVFTGSLDINEMRNLVETYLASIQPKEITFNEWADIDNMRPLHTRREIRMGMEERSSVYISWFIPHSFSEELMAIASVLEEYLDIILNDEIRESLGGVYSISNWLSINPLPQGELTGGIYFVCNPGRVEELSAAAEAKIREIRDGIIDDDIMKKAIEALLQSHDLSLQRNLFIAQSYANSRVIYNSSFSRLDRRPLLLQAVTAVDIQNMARFLLESRRVMMVLYPEE